MTPVLRAAMAVVAGGGLAIGSIPAAVSAADTGPAVRVSAGIGGIRKTGAWTPLVVTGPTGSLSAGGSVRVAVEDPDGQLVWSPPGSVEKTAAGAEAASFLVRFGRPQGRVMVDHDGSTVEHRLGEPIPATESVLLVYGNLPSLGRAARLVDREQGSTTRVVAALPASPSGDDDFAALPRVDAGRGYDAADAIVVCGGVVERLPAEVVTGIDAWVRGGGRLVFLAGDSAARVSAAASVWLPGRFRRLVPLRQPGPLEAFARTSGLGQALSAGLRLAAFDDREPRGGVVDVAAGGMPVVVRRAHGLGTVVWVGLDLDAEPVRDWPGCEAILARLLSGAAAADTREADHSGAIDLAAQLRAALDSVTGGDGFHGRRPLPFELIAVLGLLYVACLYPLDWWLAMRIGRSWVAWLSLPAIAATFTGVAWAAAGWWSPVDRLRASAAEILDIDAESGLTRAAAWAACHSPQNAALDVTAAPVDGPPATVAVSWFADAGRGFGGIDAPVTHPSLAAADYGYPAVLGTLRGVPIAAAASRLFEAEWTRRPSAPVVDSSLVRTAEGTLGGAVTHRLPQPLEGCQLLHAGWLYDVGTLAPGQAHDVASGRGPRSLASGLTRRAAVMDRDHAVRWDSTSIDVSRILEVAGFHAAAGGRGYTTIEPGRLRRLDLSPLLAVDRAVLVGVLPPGRRATDWRLVVGEERVAVSAAAPTLCRIVIPLTSEPKP